MDQKIEIKEILKLLKKKYADKMHTELIHKNMMELFVAVLLSPQCSDTQVNKVTKKLFIDYKTFDDFAKSDIKILTQKLSRLNYYKTKAKYLKTSSKIITERFNGAVPKKINELLELPGVGRKVANVILNEGYGLSEQGIAIDTHCITVSQRLGLTKNKTADKIEIDLMKIIPKKDWKIASNLLIALGRDTCTARKKFCSECVLNRVCQSSEVR